MKKRYQIVIIGGGTAGIMVASSLMRKNPKLHIGLIEPSEEHSYQPAWTLVGGGTYNFEKTKRPMKSVIPTNIDWIKDKVVNVDASSNTVKTTNGKEFSYEYLVMAPGLVLDPTLIEGLSEELGKGVVCSNYTDPEHTWKVIQNFKGGTALFIQPPKPYKCGGAPQKIMYMAEEYFKKSDVRRETKIVFASASDVIFSVKEIANTLWRVVNRKGINVRFNHVLKKIDGAQRIAWFEAKSGFEEFNALPMNVMKKDGLLGIQYDMVHVVPTNVPLKFIATSGLADENGWTDVDARTLQHTKYPNIFSLGDASNLPTSKTGAAIRKQAPVVVNNLLKLIKTKTLDSKTYDGYTSCPFVTGYGKMALAEFDYDKKFQPDPKLKRMLIKDSSKEHWRLWILKKYILPYLYWNKMLKGKEV